MASAHFRAGVVVVVRHPERREVLAFERCDTPGSWQLPQGGLHHDETPLDGAWREMFEETGLGPDQVALHTVWPGWLAYEWPEDLRHQRETPHHRIGQAQRWFLFTAKHSEIEPQPDGREFSSWRWVEPEWLISHVPVWRRVVYDTVLSAL